MPGSGGSTKLSSTAKASASSVIQASTFCTAAATSTEEPTIVSNMTGYPDYYTPNFYADSFTGDPLPTAASLSAAKNAGGTGHMDVSAKLLTDEQLDKLQNDPSHDVSQFLWSEEERKCHDEL